ncbi:MAG: metallophosphoesterase [Planctomycetota bacterium]|nr:metallophosphoesterase [Planctomycetota bacterium]
MLASLLPLAGGLVALWALLSAAFAWGARRAQRLGELRACEAFRAAPRAGAGASRTRLAFLGDVQRGIADVLEPLRGALAESGADLLISSGDLISHGEAPYYGIALAAFERAGWTTPTRLVPGNHELWPRRSKDDRIGGALFEARFGARHWVARSGPVLIVGLDNGADWLADDQLPWLRAALAAAPTAPWILVCHRPLYPFDTDVRTPHADLAGLANALRPRPPLLVVSGHLHRYHDEVVDGVRHLVNAHGGDVHGLAIRRGDFQWVRVDVEGATCEVHVESLPRRRSSAAYIDQLAVRLWSDRRKPLGALLAWPARLVLRALGRDVPVVRYPEERRVPAREVLIARRAEAPSA